MSISREGGDTVRGPAETRAPQVSGRGAGTGCWATSPVIADGPASPNKIDFEIQL